MLLITPSSAKFVLMGQMVHGNRTRFYPPVSLLAARGAASPLTIVTRQPAPPNGQSQDE
uniref:Uncharacterized protein n=1 Tax=Oryza rufipogon TaxID=4529 RepID=A0A0E0QXF5_ORYRU